MGFGYADRGQAECAVDRAPALAFVESEQLRAGIVQVVVNLLDALPRLVSQHRQRAAIFGLMPIHGDRHAVVGLTAITPITDEATEVHQIFWASPRWVAPLSPLLKPFMHTFLDQDRRVVVQQREGLVHKPKLMLINDADTQARWWMRVKDEWIAAQAQGRAFNNPLEPKTLRWRS